jgi:hypothetical protein
VSLLLLLLTLVLHQQPLLLNAKSAYCKAVVAMDGGGAYGAGKATGRFDIIAFVKKPQVILRVISWLFSVIVFGCISSQGWEQDHCRFNGNANACSFGTVIGVMAFFGLILLLVVDAMFDNISGVQHRKYAVIGDMGFSGFWTFLWFVCFCFLSDTWRRTEDDNSPWGESGVEAAIVFSFFNIGTFAGTTALAVLRYRKGVSEQFTAGYEPDVLGVGPRPAQPPYPPYPASGATDQQPADPFGRPQQQSDPYYQPPFSAGGQDQRASGDFHPVTY